ncbi:MAG: formate dehydrogenase accessory sulfurtransferase FdhD [Deltaproteobacteria bacterium]|nr:formate dehydrogenase accessory sulfurtransferase FdhD [Deltaproteobacteria bacterium]
MVYSQTMAILESIEGAFSSSTSTSFSSDHFEETSGDVCIEVVVRIHLNGDLLTSLVASPMQYRELGAGFVISEGLAHRIDDVRVEGNDIHVFARQSAQSGTFITESSGGASTGILEPKIASAITIDAKGIFTVISGIVSTLWEKTGGAHCSVLFYKNDLIAKSSDVGRHNTVDKVIGWAALNDADLSSCVLGCTGRQPAGMIKKAVNAGIPIVISKAATTREGIALADRSGLTLICRVKEDRFRIYTHPQHVQGADALNRINI